MSVLCNWWKASILTTSVWCGVLLLLHQGLWRLQQEPAASDVEETLTDFSRTFFLRNSRDTPSKFFHFKAFKTSSFRSVAQQDEPSPTLDADLKCVFYVLCFISLQKVFVTQWPNDQLDVQSTRDCATPKQNETEKHETDGVISGNWFPHTAFRFAFLNIFLVFF